MLTLPPSTRVFVGTWPTDMRKSFDGQVGCVREFLGEDPLSGHPFVFVNKSGDRLKVLWWDRGGLAIYYKRLEVGVFRFGVGANGNRLIRDLLEHLKKSQGRCEVLEHRLDPLLRRLYGPKSEVFNPSQWTLFDDSPVVRTRDAERHSKVRIPALPLEVELGRRDWHRRATGRSAGRAN